MFDFLKGGKVVLSIALDKPGSVYFTGEQIHGRLYIESQNEIKVKEGKIVLMLKEEFEYRHQVHERDSQGHTHTRERTDWHTEEHEMRRVTFMQEGVINAGSKQTQEFTFALPPNAPATAAGGRIVRIGWYVKASLDRKLALGWNTQADVYVSDVPSAAATAGDYGGSNEPGEAEMVLSLPSTQFALGETIEGTLHIRPQKTFDATEIRVALVRRECTSRGMLGNSQAAKVVDTAAWVVGGLRDLDHSATEEFKVKLAPGTKLVQGQELTLPFKIQIPTPKPPTQQTGHARVDWAISGVLARRLRGDTQVEVQLHIFNARPRA